MLDRSIEIIILPCNFAKKAPRFHVIGRMGQDGPTAIGREHGLPIKEVIFRFSQKAGNVNQPHLPY